MARILEVDNPYKPTNIEAETRAISARLQIPNATVQPTSLEVETFLRIRDAFAKVKKYVPLLVERELREAYASYRNPPSPIPVQPAPKTP